MRRSASSNDGSSGGGGDTKALLVCQPKWLSTESYSLFLLLLSTVFYSVMSCFLQLSSRTEGIPSTELVLLRAIFQGTLVVAAMAFCFKDPSGGDCDVAVPPLIRRPFGSALVWNLVVARGVVGGTGFLLYYYTMTVLPLGDAATLLSLSPVITVLAARVFLHERFRTVHVLAAASCLVGSVLLAQPSLFFGKVDESSGPTNSYPVSGYISGVLGSCCGSAVLILVRATGKKGVHVLQLMFSWCFFGLLFSAGMWVFGIGKAFVAPSSFRAWAYVLGVCVFGSAAHFFMNYSARFAPAGLASIVRSVNIVWSYFFEVVVFDEIPGAMKVAGVGLVLMALSGIALERHAQNKEAQTPADGGCAGEANQTMNVRGLPTYGSIPNKAG